MKRDYSRTRYENPNRSGRPARAWQPKRWMLPAAVVAAVVGWAWFLAFSDAFRITDIRIDGNDRIQDWEIEDALDDLMSERYAYVIPKRSLILLPEKDIRETLLSRFVLDSVSVTKEPPHTLILEVKERVSTIFMLLPDGSQAMLDLSGDVVKTYRPEEALEISRGYGPTIVTHENPAEGLPVLFSDVTVPLGLRDAAVSPSIVKAVIAIPGLLEQTFGSRVRSDEIHIKDLDSTTLRVVTTEGWSIYLNAERPIPEQLSDAKTVIQGKLGDDRRSLDHVDVRFGEKIFIKTR